VVEDIICDRTERGQQVKNFRAGKEEEICMDYSVAKGAIILSESAKIFVGL